YVIWVDDDYLDKGFHPDLLRYYLCDYTSHTKELNFSWSVFQEKINGEIIASLGNFMYRTLLFVYKNFGEVPDGNIDPEIMTRIDEAKDRYIEAMLSYEFKKAIDEAMALSDFGNGYFQSNQPWKMVKDDKNRAKAVLKGCIQLIKALIILLEPVMPGKMGEARDMINLPEEETLIKDITREIKSGQKINKPSILFEKIEDEKITEMDEILNKRLSVAEKPDGTRRI
ncbi:MAG TPA: class I tRNA ligase family protein, partial [Halobacteria archaeon]|nr:class I tRNA ligase family protein [Halobacteria archaeon]